MKTPFERELRVLLESVCEFVYHPQDVRGRKFTVPKPCDFICAYKGRLVVVEAKATRVGRFPLKGIPDHQRDTLATIAGSEMGSAWLALNLRAKRGPGQAWLVPWQWWLTMERGIGRKSVTPSIMDKWCKIWEMRRSGGRWDAPWWEYYLGGEENEQADISDLAVWRKKSSV